MALTGTQGDQAAAGRTNVSRGGGSVAPRPLRFALLGLGMLLLLAGLWAGLLRLGLALPDLDRALMLAHGPLMVAGFLGTVISLERAVALGRRWAYLAPLLNGFGAVLLVAGQPAWSAALLITAGSVVLVAVFGVVLRRQTARFTVTMTVGALIWLAANAFWLSGAPIYRVVPWWIGFLVLTIAGERLELSRLLQPSARAQVWFIAAAALVVTGLIAGIIAADAGARLMGLGLVLLAAWLAGHDVARRTVRQTGLPRFIAVSVLSGYVWLTISGLLQLWFGAVIGGPRYDAVLHSIFLGFAFAMIFAHAPIIIPSVIGRAVAYRSIFYAHLALLHLSLVLRIGADLAGWSAGRQTGGVLNEIAVLLFLAATAISARLAVRRSRGVQRTVGAGGGGT